MNLTKYWHISELDYLFLMDKAELKNQLQVMQKHLSANKDIEIEDYDGTGHIFSEEADLVPMLMEITEDMQEKVVRKLLVF